MIRSVSFIGCLVMLFSCNVARANERTRAKRSVKEGYSEHSLTDVRCQHHVRVRDTAKFTRGRGDTLYADLRQGQGTNPPLIPLTDADRSAYLQRHAPLFVDATLYFCSVLDRTSPFTRITILDLRKDDGYLLWLSYDREGRLNGLDTLISASGDGQQETTEIAYRDQNGTLMIEQRGRETLRDEQDTMAYLIDTLVFESGLTRVDELPTDPEVPPEHYGLIRTPRDLTRHWMEQTTYSTPDRIQRRSLMALVPQGKQIFQMAYGDLNNDGWNDYALVLQDDPDGVRDLQIVFTVHDSRGFVQKALLLGLLPDRNSGGFHDPIGEEGISGVSITDGHLVITEFEGSAWKSESRSEYTYSTKLDGFYLTMQQGRSYHAPTVEVMDEELAAYAQMKESGKTYSAEDLQRVKDLRKAEKDYAFRTVHYPIGKRPLGEH